MKTIFAIIFSLTLAFFSQSQKDTTALLWKIEHPENQHVSYLFGTIHLIEKEHFIFTDSLKSLVVHAEKLIMELEGVPDQMGAMQHLILQEGTCFDGFSIPQMDTLTKWAKDNLNMDSASFVNSFSSFKPFILAQLSIPLYFKGKTESYEKSFQALADSNNIKRIGLETVAFQMSLFDELNQEDMTEMVMESIRNPEKSRKFYTQLQETYATQNLSELKELLIQDKGVLMEEEDAFLNNRNKNWIPVIIEHISKSNCFIAVGAAHLIDEKGVLQLLLNQGYTLTPIKL